MTNSFVRLLLGTFIWATVAISVRAQDALIPQVADGKTIDFGGSNSPSRFEVSASLLYLQPGAGNLEYATLVTPLPLPSPDWSNQAISPNFSPAFHVGLRCLFAEPVNDFQVNWTHLNVTDGASVVASPDQFVGPSYEIGPDAEVFKIAHGSVDFAYDAINLDVGRQLFAGGPVQVRLFGGVQIASIGQNLSATFASYDGLTTSGNTTHSLFTGAGPRLGMKAECVKGNFDLLGEVAGALIIGGMQSRIDLSATSPAFPVPNDQSLTSPNATQVVPGIDTKLGGAYTFSTGCRGLFKIEAGYQAVVYFNAINEYSLSEVVTPPTTQSVGVFLRTADHLQNNFTAHGPYLTGSWLF
jgi:hypothetical protein